MPSAGRLISIRTVSAMSFLERVAGDSDIYSGDVAAVLTDALVDIGFELAGFGPFTFVAASLAALLLCPKVLSGLGIQLLAYHQLRRWFYQLL